MNEYKCCLQVYQKEENYSQRGREFQSCGEHQIYGEAIVLNERLIKLGVKLLSKRIPYMDDRKSIYEAKLLW